MTYNSNQNHRRLQYHHNSFTEKKKKSYDDPHKWLSLAHEKGQKKPFMENDNGNVRNDLFKNYDSITNDATSDEYQMNMKDDEVEYDEEYNENMIDANGNNETIDI